MSLQTKIANQPLILFIQRFINIWQVKALLSACFFFGIFMFVNANLLYYFAFKLTSEIGFDGNLTLQNIASDVVCLSCYIAIIYGIICGAVLTKPKWFSARLMIIILFVFGTVFINLCQIIAYR